MDTLLLSTLGEIEEKLGQAFTPEQIAALTEVLTPIQQLGVQSTTETKELKQSLAELSEEVKKLTVAQAQTDQQIRELATMQARTEQRVGELAQAQVRTEQRVEELAQAQARTEQRLERLEVAVERLIEQVSEMSTTLTHIGVRVSDLKGWQLEFNYQRRAGAYFGPILRRLKVLLPREIDAKMEDQLESRLTQDEFDELFRLDLLISGQPRHHPDAPRIWLAVEVSAVIDLHDVERAQRRADVLRKAGYRAIPTVAGDEVAIGVEKAAAAGNVLLIRNGQKRFWTGALQAALAD